MTRRSSGASRRPRIIASLSIAIVLLGAAVALLLLWSRGNDRAGRDLGPAAARTTLEGAPSTSGALEPGADATLVEEAAKEEEAKAEPETPPLLRGRVTGEGAGIAGAGVHLFARGVILGTIERLRDAAESGGDMPEIPVLIATVREELDRLKRNDITAVTDAEGIYEFRGIAPDSYFVLTLADGWLFRYGDVASVAGGATATLDLELERGASIAGRVVGASGGGIPGVTVVAEFRPAGLTGFGRIVHHLLRYVNGEFLRGPFEGKSAEDGSFTLASLPPGVYDLAATGHEGIEARLQGVETGSTDAVIYLGKGASAKGLAVDGSGTPVPGADFWLERQDDVLQLQGPMMMWSNVVNSFFRLIDDGPRRVRSGPRGEVHLARLGPGSYRLSIDGAGFLPFTRSFDVDWGESLDLGLLRLDRGESIRGAALDEGGAPLEGARIVAAPANVNFLNMANVFDDQVSGRASAVADASGAFRVDGLAKGKYRLVASARGHAATTKTVEAGGEPVALHLKKGVRVEGLVVSASDEKPVAGARVRSGAARATADEEGRFVLEGVTPRDPGANPFGQLVPVGRAQGTEDAPKEVKIQASAEGHLQEEVDVELASIHEEIKIAIARAPAIAGRVLDPDGSPAAGSLVRLTPAQDAGPFGNFVDPSMFFLAASLTDLDGKFQLKNFRYGEAGVRYQVVADYPGYSRGSSEPFQLEEEGSSREIEVRLERAAKLKGIVTDGSEGVPGASVRLAKAPKGGRDEQGFGMFMAMMGLPKGGDVAYAKKDGSFRFDGVAPGEYVLSAEGAGFTESKEIPLTLAAGEEKEVAITVARGGEIAGVVADTTGAPIEGAKVRLLREPGGNAEDQEGQQLYMMQKGFGGSFKSARAAADGSFRFQGLPPGKYTVAASHAGFTPREVAGLAPGKTEHRIVLEPSAILRGVVRDAGSGEAIQRFRVRVSPKDLPEAQGGAAARRFLANEREHADPEGRFTREDLAAGVAVVEVAAAGYVPASAEVLLASGRAADEEFLLAQAGRIRGRVVDLATQRPIAGARVGVAPARPSGEDPAAEPDDERRPGDGARKRSRLRRAGEDGGEAAAGSQDPDDARAMGEYFMEDVAGERVVTAEDGTFLLEDVPVGPQRIVVSHASFIPESREGLEVAAGEEITAQLALRAGLSLSGKVSSGSGGPTGGRFVFLRGASEENAHVRKSVVSGPDGEFHVGGLEKGTYRVTVAGGGGREGWGGGAAPAQSVEVGQDVTGFELTAP